MNVISTSARISPLSDIETSSRGSKVVIGDNSFVDSFVKIKFSGGLGDVVIGYNSYINAGTVIYSGHGVTIGNDVLIAANCTIAATNHEYRDPHRTIYDQRFMPSRGGIVIEDDVWLGANTVVLDGARIHRGAVVAAGSVVSGEVASYSVVGGSPIRVLNRRGT